jgi:hypothetical protein
MQFEYEKPCNAPLLSKAFKTPKQVVRRILNREIVEELIYTPRRSGIGSWWNFKPAVD